MTEEKYPEHAKLKDIQEKSQWLGEFLEWLFNNKHIELAQYKGTFRKDDERLVPASISHDPNVLLAEYFEVDLKKLELEKRAMLDEIRKANEK